MLFTHKSALHLLTAPSFKKPNWNTGSRTHMTTTEHNVSRGLMWLQNNITRPGDPNGSTMTITS